MTHYALMSTYNSHNQAFTAAYTVKPLAIVSEGTAKMMNMGIQYLWESIYMGDVQGPEKVNDSCMKTMHARMMDRGFTVFT
jgi:hypothetical protein